MYSMMGTMATQVAPTTRNASVNTCTTLWVKYTQYRGQHRGQYTRYITPLYRRPMW
jgi:hypothetical protein